LDAILHELTSIQASVLTIVPVVLGLCFAGYGIVMAMGDHSKGRQGMIYAFIGGAVALGSSTIATSIKP
jgi:hypothetical protein